MILDCTIRDGSYATGNQWDKDALQLIVEQLSAQDIQYIEIGNGTGLGAYRKNTSAMSDEDYFAQTFPIKKVARPIAICKMEGANHFVNAIGGIELYSKEEFAQYGIKLDFIQMHDITYSQKCSDGSFEPYLSIIDVLMHNGKEKTKQLLNEYTLV